MLQSPPSVPGSSPAGLLPGFSSEQMVAAAAAAHHFSPHTNPQLHAAVAAAAAAGHHPHAAAAAAAMAAAGLHGHPGHPSHHPNPEPPRPRFLFRVPRVVPNQKEKFENDDLMKKHVREGEVRYTAFRDRSQQERQAKFIAALREGHTEIAFIATGFNLVLSFNPMPGFDPRFRQLDFEKEPGKVHINSPMILNGVCVRWKGYLDIERLDGAGCLEFDEDTAKVEDIILKEQVEAYNRRAKEFEEYRKQQQRHLAAFMGQQQAAAVAAMASSIASASAASTTTASPASSGTTKTTSSSSPIMSSSASASQPAATSSDADTSNSSSPVNAASSSSPVAQVPGSTVLPADSSTSPFSSIMNQSDLLERNSPSSRSSSPPSAKKQRKLLELSATVVSSQH